VIVGVLPSDTARFPVLLCECGEMTWIGVLVGTYHGGILNSRCRTCEAPFTKGRGARQRLAATRAAIHLAFPDLTRLYQTASVRDALVRRATDDAFLMLSGGKPGGQ
jgi:hypothetical protein